MFHRVKRLGGICMKASVLHRVSANGNGAQQDDTSAWTMCGIHPRDRAQMPPYFFFFFFCQNDEGTETLYPHVVLLNRRREGNTVSEAGANIAKHGANRDTYHDRDKHRFVACNVFNAYQSPPHIHNHL